MTFDSERELFPQLNRRALTDHARRWATDKRFKGVIKISLHEYLSDKHPFRYAILFYFNPNNITSDALIKSVIEITHAISFHNVYKNGLPSDNYPNEWLFLAVDIDENMQDFSSYFWQLYPHIDRHQEQKENIPQESNVKEAAFQESVGDYVRRLRAEGKKDEIIALELHNPGGKFKLTYYKLVLALELDEGLNKTQHDAIKQRGKRMCEKGKNLLSSSAEK